MGCANAVPPKPRVPSPDDDHVFNVIVLGDYGVGKTSLMNRFTNDTFSDAVITTTGTDHQIKRFEVGDIKVRMQIWDSNGTERYRAVSNCYYRFAHAIVFAYDVTNVASFDHVAEWLADAKRRPYRLGLPYTVLVGNKIDVQHRLVTTAEGQAFADDSGMYLFETSALLDHEVANLFTHVAQACLDRKPSTTAFGQVKVNEC